MLRESVHMLFSLRCLFVDGIKNFFDFCMQILVGYAVVVALFLAALFPAGLAGVPFRESHSALLSYIGSVAAIPRLAHLCEPGFFGVEL